MNKVKYVVGDYKLCVVEAHAFLRVADWCYIEDSANFLSGGMYPFTVNAAFSCELYMKAILIHFSPTNEFPCIHELDELFALLPYDTQIQLENEYSTKSTTDLSSFLKDSRDDFIDWRYALTKEVSTTITALIAFAYTLRDYIKSLN